MDEKTNEVWNEGQGGGRKYAGLCSYQRIFVYSGMMVANLILPNPFILYQILDSREFIE